MLRSRLFWKLYAVYVGLIVVTVTVVGVLVTHTMQSELLGETRQALRGKAVLLGELIAPSLTAEGGEGLQTQVQKLGGAQLQTRLTVIAPDGKILADSEEDPAQMENHADRPEVISAREQGLGDSIRYSRTLGVAMMYVAFQVQTNGRELGFARAALPLTKINQRLARIRATTFMGAVIAIAAGVSSLSSSPVKSPAPWSR